MTDPKPCVIFDLDGTLADCSHRLHHVQWAKRDWDAFFAATGDDVPIAATLALNSMVESERCRMLHAGEGALEIFIVSGRPEATRKVSERWLDEWCIFWDYLLMRPDGDYRPDHVVKAEILQNIRDQGYEPLFTVDDRPSVVKMWRENGVPCFACDDSQWHGEESTAHGPDLEGRTLLTLMVGPTGAGKSTWLNGNPWKRGGVSAYEMGLHYTHVISSDQLRVDLCGDWADQPKNREVFAALHDVARVRLRHGLPTVIDATHLRRRDRVNAAALAPVGTRVRYVVLDRPLEDKLRDKHPRMPEAVVRKHDQTFRSQLKDILAGDGLPNVDVVDLREVEQ